MSLVGLDVAFLKEVLGLMGLSSPVTTPKRRLGTNEAHRVWMAVCEGRVERFYTLKC